MKKTRYQADVLEHFIPISIERLTADLLSSSLLTSAQQTLFKQFCARYAALLHAQSHSQLQRLKFLYQPFNPDKEALIIKKTETSEQLSSLKSELYSILEDANYEKISENDLNKALNKISPHGVKVSVDFSDFSDVALFYRGSAVRTEFHRDWKRFQFKKREIEILIYRRLFVLLQPRNRQGWVNHLSATKKISLKKAEKEVDSSLKAIGINGDGDTVYIKLFKDIPRADLEMLFPNTRIQIRLFDKIKLSLMGGGGTVGGVMATVSKLSASIDPVSAVLAVGGLLAVIWRQIAKIFSQRAKYSAILTKNLYFYSLDNNMGVLTYLANTAEHEECKEAILAYFFLLTGGKSTHADLDQSIENYIDRQYGIPMDFEVKDGLEKLQKANLLTLQGETITALPLNEANASLIRQWNDTI
jgi:hypothetical protein